MELKLFVCKHCGNVVWKVVDKGVPLMCCGQKMEELIPGTTDAAVEKHVPVVQSEGAQVTVTVGSVEHPMLPEHFIEWIALETKEGVHRLTPLGSDFPDPISFDSAKRNGVGPPKKSAVLVLGCVPLWTGA